MCSSDLNDDEGAGHLWASEGGASAQVYPRVVLLGPNVELSGRQQRGALDSKRKMGRKAPERVNDIAAPFVMNLLRRLVVISVRRSPKVVG